MARRGKILSYRRHAETFTAITWVEANRLAHEAKRPHPKFADAALLEWSRALKRKDLAHRDIPERSQALVAFRQDVWERLGGTGVPEVCFVVFSKVDHAMRLITIRYATDEEYNVFYTTP